MSDSAVATSELLEPIDLNGIQVENRFVMAPMTRSRAVGNVPNDLMVEYYRQRAGAGLIVTEGTAPSPNGLGYPRIPGIFQSDQVAGWRKVTDAVHAEGGRIFVQLMHTGRVSHPDNLPGGAEVVAPSAVALEDTKMWVDGEGELPIPEPRAMTADDVLRAIDEYVDAARKAIVAGFDGVELHGANGYLIQQFIHPVTNQRDDDWGGSIGKRIRFPLEVARAVADAVGGDRVGIRISPYGVFNEMPHYDQIDETYEALVKGLDEIGLAYLHVVDHSSMGAPELPQDIQRRMRALFSGAYVLSGGYGFDEANEDLAEDQGDLVAFGRPFLANPDLVERFRRGAELNEPDPSTFYTPGSEGYLDYPALEG
ncbi:MAG: alkene reductase [Gemmatimonadetes bacterium]|nr:alkene reductase [Gemmatimonadota bacterium]